MPRISIITPVYNTPAEFLAKAYNSVKAQGYTDWEWCVADDCSTDKETLIVLDNMRKDSRVKVSRLLVNGGIGAATIEAVKISSSAIIAFMDSDDTLTPDALQVSYDFMMQGSYDLVYSDEDIVDIKDAQKDVPHYKPDYSPHYLESNNYICHFVMTSRALYDKVGGVNIGFDGSQDHDFLLRVSEATSNIGHIQKILYHWRHFDTYTRTEKSQITTSEVSKKALLAHINRKGYEGSVYTKMDTKANNTRLIYYHIKTIPDMPLVSIIIPFKDNVSQLYACLNSIVSKTTYAKYNITIIYSDKVAIEKFIHEYPQFYTSSIRWVRYVYPQFNIAQAYNMGVRQATGSHICTMHAGTEIENDDWLQQLLTYSIEPEVGCVSGKILNKFTRNIVYAGAYITPDTLVKPFFHNEPEDTDWNNRGYAVQNTSVMFSMLMLFKKKDYLDIDGFNEAYSIYHADIDFCLRLAKLNKSHVYIPVCTFTHNSLNCRQKSYTPHNFVNTVKANDDLFKTQYVKLLMQTDPYTNVALTRIKTPLVGTARTVDPRPVTITALAQKDPKALISYIIPWYEDAPTTLVSLLAQTHANIECIVVYDGPIPDKAMSIVNALNDTRIKLVHTKQKTKNWGHSPRDYGIDHVSDISTYTVFCGMDNYYFPTFTSEMLTMFTSAKIKAAYSNFYYNGHNWNLVNTRLSLGFIDCGCFVVRTEIAKELRWLNVHYEADWSFIQRVVSTYGVASICKLNRSLFIHN